MVVYVCTLAARGVCSSGGCKLNKHNVARWNQMSGKPARANGSFQTKYRSGILPPSYHLPSLSYSQQHPPTLHRVEGDNEKQWLELLQRMPKKEKRE